MCLRLFAPWNVVYRPLSTFSSVRNVSRAYWSVSMTQRKLSALAGSKHPLSTLEPSLEVPSSSCNKRLKTDGSDSIRILSWNVNGIRACHKKDGLSKMTTSFAPDIVGFTEVKCQSKDKPTALLKSFPYIYWNAATIKKGGYSGSALCSKKKPLKVSYGVGAADDEGRVITAEYEDFFVVVTYVPNSGAKLERLEYRTGEWDAHMRRHLQTLQEQKPVIWCGDLNVAYLDIDIHDPIRNKNKTAGFCDGERANFGKVLNELKFVDAFRHLHPDLTHQAYTYFSYRFKAKEKKKGWRLDYFLVSESLRERLLRVEVKQEHVGSDHYPLILDLATSDPPQSNQ